MITIYSIIPSLRNEEGHFYEYNKAFTKVAKLNNWKHIKIIPKNCSLEPLGDDWQKLIYPMDVKNKIKNFKNFIPFLKIFKKLKKYKQPIIFIEDFNIIILFLVLICSFIIRPKIKLWLLFRFEFDVMFFKGKISLIILRLLESLLGGENIKCFTDSKLVAKRNEKFYKRDFVVLPIPHTYLFEKASKKSNKDLYFWWPGGLIRKEKGLDRIIHLSKILKSSKVQIKLILAKSAQNFIEINNNVLFLSNDLSRDQYCKWMSRSDLVLLPYHENLYQYRTSGIFVEAISFGTIPVVSKKTWMAYELDKYNLSELIIDWDRHNLLDLLTKICSDKKIKTKILKMRNDYKFFHCYENFAKEIKKHTDFSHC